MSVFYNAWGWLTGSCRPSDTVSTTVVTIDPVIGNAEISKIDVEQVPVYGESQDTAEYHSSELCRDLSVHRSPIKRVHRRGKTTWMYPTVDPTVDPDDTCPWCKFLNSQCICTLEESCEECWKPMSLCEGHTQTTYPNIESVITDRSISTATTDIRDTHLKLWSTLGIAKTDLEEVDRSIDQWQRSKDRQLRDRSKLSNIRDRAKARRIAAMISQKSSN